MLELYLVFLELHSLSDVYQGHFKIIQSDVAKEWLLENKNNIIAKNNKICFFIYCIFYKDKNEVNLYKLLHLKV